MSSSSNDGKMESGSKSKLDIEAFRNHLLNYRSKPDDSELDASDHFVDLDSSFKRMLDEKRQMTNKENKPPAAGAAAVAFDAALTSINAPEKPLRKDLLKERLRSRMQDDSLAEQSSYMLEHSIGTDMEFSTINRLLADFNINRESTISQKRSPLKSLKITSDTLNDSLLHPQNSDNNGAHASSSLALARDSQANHGTTEAPALTASSATVSADDTLEEIEYVLDRGLNYVPKRLVNEIKLQSEALKQETIKAEHTEHLDTVSKKSQIVKIDYESTQNAEVSMENDGEIIVIDSSPETSFASTLATAGFKSAFESIENTFYTAKSILNNDVSVVSIESDEFDEESDDTIEQESESQQQQPIDLQKTDISATDSLEMSTSTQIENSTAGPVENVMVMPAFNDSLERIEYMMEQAQKMMDDNAKKSAPPLQTEAKKTPVSQTKLKPKVLTPTPHSLSLKKKGTPKTLTPNKCGDPFKRPDQRQVRSPFTGKSASASKTQTQSHSRIPMKTGSLHKPQFRHIASPIAAYIKNTPEVPLLKTIKPMRNLLTEDFNKVCKSAGSSLDESTQSVESFPLKSTLPRKMYISAQQRKVIDHRYIVTPGGKTVQKLIGNPPLVIRHDGKIKSHNSPARIIIPQMEESLSDLSMVSGDISVQVVQDAHRLN